MADLQQAMQALRNAHNAGDVQAATRLAGIVRKLQSEPQQTTTDRSSRLGELLASQAQYDTSARDSTIGEEFKRGFRQVGSGTRTGIASLLNPEEAATQGLERSQAISEDYGVAPSLAGFRQTYEDEGLMAAAGELAGQVPRALAGQAGNVATVIAGSKAGAMLAPPFPVAKLIGGGLGATAALLPMLLGSNVERQATTQLERGEDVDIDMSNALLAAAGQSAAEGVGTGLLLGKRLVKGLLGITDDAALATTQAQQALVRTAEQTRLGAAGRGVVRGAATEMPVEVAQSIMERAQAGLDVLSDDALAEYGEAAYLGGIVGGGIRGTTAAFEPGAARRQVAEQAAAQTPPVAPTTTEEVEPSQAPATPTETELALDEILGEGAQARAAQEADTFYPRSDLDREANRARGRIRELEDDIIGDLTRVEPTPETPQTFEPALDVELAERSQQKARQDQEQAQRDQEARAGQDSARRQSIADIEAELAADMEKGVEAVAPTETAVVTPTKTTPPPSAAATPTPTPPPPPTTPMQFGSAKVANAAARQIATELGVDISDADLAALVKPTIRFALPSREPAIRKALQKMVPAAAATTPAATTPAATTPAATTPAATTPAMTAAEQEFRAKVARVINNADQVKLAEAYQTVVGEAPPADVKTAVKKFSLPEQVAIANEFNSIKNRPLFELPGRFNRKADSDTPTVEVNGKQRSTTNSNGQPLAATEDGVRAFWRWFGDSKVVNDVGRPLRVFHGTNVDFDQFATDISSGRKRFIPGELGTWFGSTPEVANSFARGVITPRERGMVYPVYLNIQNPKVYDSYEDFLSEMQGRRSASTVKKELQEQGFDGIQIKNSTTDFGGLRDDWVAFKPTQIKSAVGNQGTFDPNSPAITASVQPKREEAASIPANVRLMDRVRRGDSTANILGGISQDTDVPQPLRNLARSMLRVAPNITVPVIERRYKEPDVVGQYVHPQQGDEAIYLDPRAESAAQTFLHEFVHPMTVNAIARGTPEGKRVVQLFEQYKEQHPESTAYGFENAYEFVAEGITNQNFQKTLKRQNWWGRFTDAIRRIIGLPASQSGTVEELIDLTKRMGAAENISRTQKAAEQVIFNDTPQNNIRFLRVQGAQLNGASVPVKAPKFKRAVAAMFDKGQESVTRAMVWGLGLDQINDYVQSYVKKKGPAYEPFVASFNRFTKIAGKLEGEMRQFIDGITAQVARMGDWRNSHPDLYDDMNTLVYGGTLGKVDLTKPKSTYAKKPEQLKEYERLEKVLKKLEPSGGAAIYRQMRAIYNRVFNGITQQVYDGVYSATQDADLATTIKNKFTEQMKLRGLEGYAALTRNNGKYRIKFFLPNSDTPYFETFENSADWEARQRQLVTEDGVNQNDMTPFLHGDRSVFDGIVPTSFMGDLVQTLKNKNASADLLAAVMELGISVSPAQVVMERLVARKETPGYTLDAFAAFQESVVGLQRKLINMKYSAQMSKEVRDMEATRSNVKTDPTVVLLIDEVRNRAAYAANPNQNAISNILTTGTYGWTLGLNVSSAVVDMLSLIVTGGYLSGRFKSRRKAHAALVKAGSDILGMGTTADVETMVTQGLDGAALQEAMKTAGINERDVTRRRVAPSMLNIDFNNPEQAKKYGYLKSLVDKVRDQGHSERFSDLEERAEFGESNILSKISARMGFMMSTSERYKRETGLKAFYDLALAEVAPNADPTKATKEQMEKAADEAMNMSRLLNGGSTPVTGPGFQRDNFWRVAFMYRSFAFRQMYVQVKTLYDATMNDEKAVKDAARKFGSTVLLTSGALVGVQGMPFFGPVALLLNVLAAPFVDDEEEEKFVQNMLRSNLDPLIYEGLPNALLNMNVSERASLTDLLVRDTNLPEDASFAETMAAHFGGPAVGSMERFWRGKGLIEQGEIQRGLESMIPVTLSNVLKSIRFATDGAAETLRGDEVTEISPIAVVSQFLGFTPADYARTMEFKSIQAGVDRRIAERKANLYAAAYAAYRFGDSAGLAQVMQKMIEFNQQHPEEAIKNRDLKQSLQARARNSENMLGGTLPRESRRAEWQEAADDWGVEFPN